MLFPPHIMATDHPENLDHQVENQAHGAPGVHAIIFKINVVMG